MGSLGWTDCRADERVSSLSVGIPPGDKAVWVLPNLTLDLMHKAEITLQHYGAFCDELAKVMGVKRGSISLVCATKEQRLEAYLRVKGLWREES